MEEQNNNIELTKQLLLNLNLKSNISYKNSTFDSLISETSFDECIILLLAHLVHMDNNLLDVKINDKNFYHYIYEYAENILYSQFEDYKFGKHINNITINDYIFNYWLKKTTSKLENELDVYNSNDTVSIYGLTLITLHKLIKICIDKNMHLE